MRVYFPFLLILASFQSSIAQEFFDQYWKPVKTKAEATYYRTIEKQGNLFMVKDFYCSNDQLEMEALCAFIKPELIKHGKVVCYHENGKLASESYYDYGDRQGIAKSYYEDGNPEKETLNASEGVVKYLQVWTDQGEPALKNGTGLCIKNRPAEQAVEHREYKDSVLYTSFIIRTVQQDTVYEVLPKMAEFKGGFDAMARFVGQTLRYPVNSRRKGIQGTVFVSFIVDKKGKLNELEIIKGVSDDIDEEGFRCVKELSGKWISGMHNDRKVKSKYVLPIKFKLAG